MSDNSVNNKRIAKNTAFLYIRMLLVLFVSLYTTRVVLNALGVEDYGINNVVAGFVSMFSFLNTSMSNGIQRFYNYQVGREGQSSFTKVYNTSLLVQGLLAFVVIFLLESVGLWYLHTKMVIPSGRLVAAEWIYQFSVFSLALVIIQIPYSSAIMASEKMDFYAYVSVFDVLAKLLVAVLLPIVSSDKLIMYGLFILIIQVIITLSYIIYSKLQIKGLKIEFSFHRDLFKSILSFSGWNIFGTFSYMLKGQGLNVLLNAFFGVIVNSARGISNMIMSAIQGFQANVVISFRPQLVQSYASGDIDRVKNLMYSLSKISYVLLYTLSLPVIIEINYILKIWLGDSIPDYTVPFTILVLVNMIISSLNTPLSQVVHATGKMKAYQITTSVVICSIIPISWAVLKLGGDPVSVFWVSLFVTAINQAVCMVLLKRIFAYSMMDYIKQIILPCLFFSFLAPVVPIFCHFILDDSFFRLLIVCFLAVVISAGIAYCIVLNKAEKALIISFCKKKLHK